MLRHFISIRSFIVNKRFVMYFLLPLGWATSEETKPVSSLPPGITEDKNHSSYMPSFWPINDLGLKNLSVTNDDELGIFICILCF